MSPQRPGASRSPVPLVAAGALLLVLGLGAAWWWTGSDREPQPVAGVGTAEPATTPASTPAAAAAAPTAAASEPAAPADPSPAVVAARTSGAERPARPPDPEPAPARPAPEPAEAPAPKAAQPKQQPQQQPQQQTATAQQQQQQQPRPPTILAFDAEAGTASVKICYRLGGAQTATLAPRPGALVRSDIDCVRVPLSGPTRFTLVARNATASAERSLDVAPRPMAAAPTRDEPPAANAPATPPAVAASPTPTPAPAVDTALPRVGETWVYRRSGKWRTSPSGTFTVTIRSLARDAVVESLRTGTGAGADGQEQRTPLEGAAFVRWDAIGTEFSPFLAVGRGGSERSVDTPDLFAQWTQWHSRASIAGPQTVTVPAGRYETVKIEVWSTRNATGSAATARVEPTRVFFQIWYARAAKRYVQMRRTVTSADNTVIDDDLFQLVEHRR